MQSVGHLLYQLTAKVWLLVVQLHRVGQGIEWHTPIPRKRWRLLMFFFL